MTGFFIRNSNLGLLKTIQQTQKSLIQRGFSNSRIINESKKDLDTVVVIGCGLMGSGIAEVTAQSGRYVRILDTSSDALKRSKNIIENSISKLSLRKLEKLGFEGNKQEKVNEEINKVLNNITFATINEHLEKALLGDNERFNKGGHAKLVIEAIVENVEVKRNLFNQLDKLAHKDTILASNTSSLPISEIAKGIKNEKRAQEQTVGLHFFNPVPQMKLVEIVRREHTSKELTDVLTNVTKDMKKVPVLCKDTPGFIVNRLLVPYMFEAIRLLERGDATKEDIDIAMKLGAGYPMGPFELLDYVGLDTCKFIADGWFKESPLLKGNELVKSSPILDDLVKNGKLGRKSGEGFYLYKNKK